jgi:hypothetical protein
MSSVSSSLSLQTTLSILRLHCTSRWQPLLLPTSYSPCIFYYQLQAFAVATPYERSKQDEEDPARPARRETEAWPWAMTVEASSFLMALVTPASGGSGDCMVQTTACRTNSAQPAFLSSSVSSHAACFLDVNGWSRACCCSNCYQSGYTISRM